MSDQASRFHLDIPGFGKIPLLFKRGERENDPNTITHDNPSMGSRPGVVVPSPRLSMPSMPSLSAKVAQFDDPTTRVPQFAVLNQKVVTLTGFQLNNLPDLKDLQKNEWRFGINKNAGDEPLELKSARIVANLNDCLEEGKDQNGSKKVEQTVLLIWDELDPAPELFLNVVLFKPGSKAAPTILDQTNNFVLSGYDGGPNNPPPTPPWTAASSSLSTQPTDYKVATAEDIQHYKQFNGQDKRPAVAVLDTGLKFNLLNFSKNGKPEGDYKYGPYTYLDADGVERQFKLAYRDPKLAPCDNVVVDNPLGYCAIQNYRDQDFSLITSLPKKTTSVDIVNSPYDDCQVMDKTDGKKVLDARHGSTITALIQQNGDDAPVLPVKAFDNAGYTTLFDVLRGFTYILHCHESANIRVINASWICTRNEPLLEAMINRLMNAGIFVIAAAGNENQTTDRDLDITPAYPACYSKKYPNVITVTSVRKTYIPHKLVSRQGDSVISGLLNHAISDLGLFGLLETGDDVVGAILPTAGYVAVENFSTTFVNVGVVSTFGYFRSPFQNGDPIRGSSYACALVSAFVIEQLSTRPDIMSSKDVGEVRQKLLAALSGSDDNLKEDYVNGGYYLAGHEVE